MYQWNQLVKEFTCLRCSNEYVPNDYLTGCPHCLYQGYPVSLQVTYDHQAPWEIDESARGLFRYVNRLPYRTFPTLGEGGTPVIKVKGLEEELGLTEVWIKNEGQNPTGSHKDRMSPLIVARAVALKRSAVIAASSGNAGASLAAYAAAAGIHCKIVTTSQIQDGWEKAIRITGAEIIKVSDSYKRWEIVKQLVENQDLYPATNYHIPPVGSNLFGVQGLVTVGLEIAEQMSHMVPAAIVIPCARGDLIWGIWAGLTEAKTMGWIKQLPRLYAVEPFPRLLHVLSGRDYREEFEGDSNLLPSIGGTTVTYQSLFAVRSTGGTAVVVSNEEVGNAQNSLARKGIYAEGSSAATYTAVTKLVQSGAISKNERVLMIITSHGYKGV
ncbi:pyridoxal-phosphate dependent enzyme [Brevibacillus agri]|uniref:threonine synthase n=1 Tax=Brevibacillus TaxID=55080 RepID=UPI00203B18A8|nr:MULTISPECIES: pyridoxal-phosphate dependent enzyme [Brevibacillus]MCM3432610.1 pyridoxal-phosphate dependent enzyme [Brevibacillus invocatus]MED1645902.1 pyridoxal-phosphate dependent enzyme [Brevibacillus agri]MED1657599.1 pyridoxal-phosphate dependent enzyme [Brevibacillus agri]MED1690091.1 pyridoxal-phosphate dependent enzyme [Brevibacillus agri]MED1693992.1 pyridoxal-phosphate dependent enzyme [Brevibacillus agri]